MTCILKKNPEVAKKIQYIAEKLAVGETPEERKNDFERNEEKYKNIAYFVLASNFGNMYDCDTKGNRSDLWDKLLLKHKGDERAAILEKALIYTPEYAEQHGEWADNEDISEPTETPFGDTEDLAELLKKVDEAATTFADQNEHLQEWLNDRHAICLINKPAVLNRGVGKEMEKYVNDHIDYQKVDSEVAEYKNSHQSATPRQIDNYRESRIRALQYHLKQEFCKQRIEIIATQISKKLAEAFDLKQNENGIIDTSDMPNNEDNVEDLVNLIRANFINHVREMLLDPLYEQQAHAMIQTYMDSDNHIVDIIPLFVPYYIDIYKNTAFFHKLMMEHFGSDYDTTFKMSKKTGRAAYYRDVEFLKKDITKFLKKVAKGKEIEKKNWLYHIYEAIRTAFSAIRWSIPHIKYKTMGLFLKEYKEIANKHEFLKHSVRRHNYNIVMSLIAMHSSLCTNLRVNTEYESDEFIDHTLLEHGDTLKQTLLTMKKNLEKRKDSVKSLLNRTHTGISDESRINQLLQMVNDALISQENTKKTQSAQFLHSYFTHTSQLLNDALSWLQKVQRGEEPMDVQRMMYIKSDVLGSYKRIVNELMLKYIDKLPLEETKQNTPLYNLIANDIAMLMSVAEGTFEQVLEKYITDDITNYLEQTVKKTYGDGKYYNRIRENMIDWVKEEIRTGDLGILQTRILGANVAESPIVRMIHERLEEIEEQADALGNVYANKLEQLRVSQRSFWKDRVWVTNSNVKYYEVDDEGNRTGNLVSDINRGQYDKDYNKIRQYTYNKVVKNIKSQIDQLIEDSKHIKDQTSQQFVDIKAKIKELQESLAEFKYQQNEERQTYPTDDAWRLFLIVEVLWQAGYTSTSNIEHLFPTAEDYKKFGNDVRNILSQDTSKEGVKAERRYKPEYYIARACILSLTAYDKERHVNRELARIKKDCIKTIEVKGEKRRYFDISDLPDDSLIRYRQLQDMKAGFASPFHFTINYSQNKDGVIEDVTVKEGVQKQIADEFEAWNRYQDDHFREEPEVDEDFYKAVYDQIEADVIKFRSELALLQRGTEEYELKDAQLREAEKKLTRFVANNTERKMNPVLLEYLDEKIVGYEYGNDPVTNEYRQLVRQRTAIEKRIRSLNKQRTPNLSLIGSRMWAKLKELDTKISDLLNQIQRSEKTEDTEYGGLKWKEVYAFLDIPMIDDFGEEIQGTSYTSHLLANGMDKDLLSYWGNDNKTHPLHILRRIIPNATEMLQYVSSTGNIDDLYVVTPTGSFVKRQNNAINEAYDEESDDYVQISKDLYHNKLWDDLKLSEGKDEFYNNVVSMLDEMWENYEGVHRKYKFRLPQRRGSSGQIMAMKMLGKAKSATKQILEQEVTMSERDVDYSERIVTMPDGSIVELLPLRWVDDLEEMQYIDTDLVSLMSDAYQESLRYKLRRERQAPMEAYKFMLQGGFSKTGGDVTSDQATLLKNEINRGLYGRTITGSGKNGRLTPGEKAGVKFSKSMRKIMHNKLMAHNWMSVLKNSWDSFWNMIQAVYTGKYFEGVNFRHAMWRMGSNFFNSLFTWNRTKVVQGDMTNALLNMHGLNGGVNERFKDTYKWGLRRAMSKQASIEFSVTDLTAKALILESTYDAYRLVYNYNTGRHEYMNREEVEMMYYGLSNFTDPDARLRGYKVWELAAAHTLRDAYTLDEYGAAVLREKTIDLTTGKEIPCTITMTHPDTGEALTYNIIDLVRPKTKEAYGSDGRSRVLETKIRTTIRLLAGTVNGMLDTADRNQIARDYRGALVVAFRGWMIAQAGQYYKTGNDFEQIVRNGNKNEKNPLDNFNFEGLYNFGTGTIDKGLHRDLYKVWWKHIPLLLRFMTGTSNITTKFGGIYSRYNKYRLVSENKNLTMNEYYQLRNLAIALDSFLITTALTALCAGWLTGGDDDDPLMSEIYTALLASISERFPGLGALTFASQVLELVNGVTVGTSVINEGNYVVSLIKDTITGTHHDVIKQGTFKGKENWVRDISRGFSTFGVDVLPELLALDMLKSFGIIPEDIAGDPDFNFTDLHLNWYRNTHTVANKERAKFYRNLFPTKFIDMVLPISPKGAKQGGKSKKSKTEYDFNFDFKQDDFNFNFDFK